MNNVLKKIVTCLLISGLSSSFSLAQNIKLNQLGFYPQSEKTGIIPNGKIGSFFYIVEQVSNDTVMLGSINNRSEWALSGETVSKVDFSPVSEPGLYKLLVNDTMYSFPFEIRSDLYQDLLKASIKSYYFQRCSAQLLATHAGEYTRALGHPDNIVKVHPEAASSERPAGTIISGTKGWYDAGDYNKYIVNSGITTYTLLATFEYFNPTLTAINLNIPESGNNAPDILDEIKWNLDWMLAMQDPYNGGVYHKLSSKNFSGYITPAQDNAERYVLPKTTAASYNFAAVMAQASRVFKPYEENFPGFSKACLDASLQAWQWGRSNSNVPYEQPDDVVTGEYGDSNLDDERKWAAVELYITTKADSFYTAADIPSITANVPSWQSVATLGLLSLARHRDNLTGIAESTMIESKILALADQLKQTYRNSPYGISMGATASDFVWGSNGHAANQSIILIVAFDLTNDGSYFSAAYANLDYLLGRNPLNLSFVTGYGGNRPMNPHHRPSISDNITEPVPGLLVGGPNPGQQDKCNYTSSLPALSYVDDKCSYASNEVAINWNAPLVFALTATTHFLRSDIDRAPFIISQPTISYRGENEPIKITVNASGSDSLNYQWFKNGVEIFEQNSRTFIEPNPKEGDTFNVKISNENGSVTSDHITFIMSELDLTTSLNLAKVETYIFPNPSESKRIYFKSNGDISTAMVLDSKGMKLELIKPQEDHIDLSNWPSGVYFICLLGRDKSKVLLTKKVILQ